jgi:hypothetical protein
VGEPGVDPAVRRPPGQPLIRLRRRLQQAVAACGGEIEDVGVVRDLVEAEQAEGGAGGAADDVEGGIAGDPVRRDLARGGAGELQRRAVAEQRADDGQAVDHRRRPGADADRGVVDHALGDGGAGPAGEVPGTPPPAVLARDDGRRGQEHRRAQRAVIEVVPARPGLVHQRPAGVADAVRGLDAAIDQLPCDPQRMIDEEVGRSDVELGVRGVLGLGRVAAVDRLRQRAADANELRLEVGRGQRGHPILHRSQSGSRVAVLDQHAPADADGGVVGQDREVRHVEAFERLALADQDRPDLGRVVRSVDGPVQRIERRAPPAPVLLIARPAEEIDERGVLRGGPRQHTDRRAGEGGEGAVRREQRLAMREEQPVGRVEAFEQIGGERVGRLDRAIEADGVADSGREGGVVGEVDGVRVEIAPDAAGEGGGAGPGAAQAADVEDLAAVRLDHRHEAGGEAALAVRGRRRGGGPPGRDRLAARQRRARGRRDLGDRLQQHLEVDQHRAAAGGDHVLHVEIAAAQHVGEADQPAGEREVGPDLGQAGAGLLLDELDPPVLAAIEDPQGQAGEAARDVGTGDAGRRRLRRDPRQERAVGGVETEAARLVDDAEAGRERQRRDPASAVVRVGQRRLDVDDQAGVGAVAEGRGQGLAIDDDARREFRRRAHPAPDDHGDLARQHRVVGEQRHQAVGELAADEGVVAAALGGTERLELVEERELRGAGEAAKQMPLEPRHRSRRENSRRMLAGKAPPRHPQHRHQEVEERRQLGVPDGVGRARWRQRGAHRVGACVEPALGERAVLDVGDRLAGGAGDGVDVDQPVGLDDRDRGLGQRPGDVGHRQVVPGQAALERLGIARREGLDPGPQHAQGLFGGRERFGPARLAGEREGGPLEDAGGPDCNLAPLVTGEVGELGQGLHRGHPDHGFKS